jgi:hypothetical protein
VTFRQRTGEFARMGGEPRLYPPPPKLFWFLVQLGGFEPPTS